MRATVPTPGSYPPSGKGPILPLQKRPTLFQAFSHIRPVMRLVRPALLLVALTMAPVLTAQSPSPDRVSIIYTGRSLGALGVRRAQDEHELLTEQARAESLSFKLVSHAAYRAPGIVVFLPSTEPTGAELAEVIARRSQAEVARQVRALASATVVLLQDPWNADPDLLAMVERNPRRLSEFPDLVPTTLRVSRLRSSADDRVIIVEQPGAVWPTDPTAWTRGEMNRVDIGEARLFELPLNLGGLGPRATLVRTLQAEAGGAAATLVADLGHQAGDVVLQYLARARVDFAALQALGYSVVVPFESELALGADGLRALRTEYPEITLLAANVRLGDSLTLTPSQIVTRLGRRVGLVGLVNPTLRDRLPRTILAQLTFEPPAAAARREVARLRAAGVDAVVVLSNLDPGENAVLAQEVPGIDAIVADLPVRAAPEAVRLRVELPDRPYVRPGTPALVARSAANGIGVGALAMEFRPRAGGEAGAYVTALDHRLLTVTDRVPSDTALVRRLTAMADLGAEERGELMFPSFTDIIARHPALADVDAVTRRGRVSQAMWEGFMARRLRVQASAEAAVIRRLGQFAPLIGKLHENEIGEWLWTEDEIVVVDLPGADLRALLRSDTRGELVTSGIDLSRNTVLGHTIADDATYRVATTDVLLEGARARYFGRALRQRRRFFWNAGTGALTARPDGEPIALRELILSELRRVRTLAKGDAQIDSIAVLLASDPVYVDVTTFSFDRPTVWASLNSVSGNGGYVGVPESRILAKDAWVAGVSGRFVLMKNRRVASRELGLGFAFAEQRISEGGAGRIETADDIKLDWTVRPSFDQTNARRLYPFLRGLFDTEFSPTVNPTSKVANPRQLSLRAVGGVMRQPTARVRRADLGVVLENDFGRPNPQAGLQSRIDVERPLRSGVTYRLRNDLTYFLPTGEDTPADLALRYSMVHDVLVPIADELSLSISADFFFFQGKVPATRALGVSSQLRVGITYDRLWKPRYQPFL